jgi:AcrR family transcriptional regulator
VRPSDPEPPAAPTRRLSRVDRREQILAAATKAFARSGYAATSLNEVAAEAGISHVILYRHFDSKADLYRAVLNRACTRLAGAVGDLDFTEDSVDALLVAAIEDPAGFRLLFHHAAREPDFRAEVDEFRHGMQAAAHRELASIIASPAWANWAAALTSVVATEAIIAWLDAGQPDRDQVSVRIHHAVDGIIEAAVAAPDGNAVGKMATDRL